MDDLRLIGVHEDGEHLLLATGDGDRFRLRIDDAIRAAVRRDRPRLGQLQIEIDGGVRPREVQAMIRAGASAQEVSDRTGWPVEKVERYEGPIVAEREHVAGLAREVRLRGRGPSGTVALGSRVGERLTARGVDSEHVLWDSFRSDDGTWSVTVSFPAGGRERVATWHFDSSARTVHPRDDEARWLTEDDSHEAPIPPRRGARGSAVFDVEAEGGVHEGPAPRQDGSAHPGESSDEPIDLMTAIREHSSARSRRRGSRRHGGPDAASRGRAGDAIPIEGTPPDDTGHDSGAPGEDDQQDAVGESAGPPRDAASDDSAASDLQAARTDEAGEEASARPGSGRTTRRKGRPSVPSWDDVMFGGGGGGRRGS